MNALPDHVIDYVRNEGLLRDGDSWLLCVSGGADSMALMHIAEYFRRRGLLRAWHCIHFNHQLRGRASDKDEAFVRQAAATLSVSSVTKRLPVKAFAKEHKLSMETAARELRWRACGALVGELGCSAVATGHQQDDNAETMLHRIGRGTGFRGLAGIWPCRTRGNCRIVRPLLCVGRDDIRRYLEDHGVAWREDRTNRDCRMTRNFIRHRLLPHLEKDCHTPLTEALARLSSGCRRHHRRTCTRARRLAPQAIVSRAGDVRLDVKVLRAEPSWVQLELIRRALHMTGCGEQDLTERHYRRLLCMLAETPPTKTLTLPSGLRAHRSQEALAIGPATPEPSGRQVPLPRPRPLAWPGTTHIGPFTVRVSLLDPQAARNMAGRVRRNPFVEVLDSERLRLPLSLRLRRPGDRFQPLGRERPTRLGKFLNRQKGALKPWRDVLLVCDADSIVWVWPVRLGHQVRIMDSTRRFACIEILEKESRG